MTLRIETTKEQRDSIDAAILLFLQRNSRSRRVDIQRDPAVADAIMAMPQRSDEYRYVDQALQRLQGAGKVTVDVYRWSLKPAREVRR